MKNAASSTDRMELNGREILSHAIDHVFESTLTMDNTEQIEACRDAHKIMREIEWRCRIHSQLFDFKV